MRTCEGIAQVVRLGKGIAEQSIKRIFRAIFTDYSKRKNLARSFFSIKYNRPLSKEMYKSQNIIYAVESKSLK